MASFKRLKRSDVISVPYVANKNWVYNYCSLPKNDQYITIHRGTKITGSFVPYADPITEGEYERLVYNQINHLFYQQYSSSADILNTGSLMASLYYEGASSHRLTSSYFNYNENPGLIKFFPTGVNEGIRVLSISQDLYGQQLLPYHFELSSSEYYIKDDGIGNLIDYKNSSTYVGNIFYSHGISVITHRDYQFMFPVPPFAGLVNAIFQDTDSPKIIYPTARVQQRSGNLLPMSMSVSGSNASLFTVNTNGTITCNISSPGTYEVYYTISSSLDSSTCSDKILGSNPGKIVVSIYDTP
jgi:hypothetical protein